MSARLPVAGEVWKHHQGLGAITILTDDGADFWWCLDPQGAYCTFSTHDLLRHFVLHGCHPCKGVGL